jgi:predicted peptidase
MQLKKIFLIPAVIFIVGVCLNVGLVSGAQDAKSNGETRQTKQAKEAQRLKNLAKEKDKLVKAIKGLELTSQKQKKAVEFIDKYIAEKTNVKEDSWPNYPVLRKLMNELQEDLEKVLSDHQMATWINKVFKTEKDNWQYVKDDRIEHRTYKFKEAADVEIPYALFVPTHYNPKNKYPIIVGLHGMECAHDTMMASEGLLDLAERDGFIVVTPLGYRWNSWYGSLDPSRAGQLCHMDVKNVLDIARSEFNIDENRIYMFGHSMGGAGTYYVAEKYPDIWAGLAVAAPAPFVSEDSLEKIKHIPILVIQGDQDQLVKGTRKWVAKMKELGMQHVYIEIPGADHSFAGNSSRVFSFFNIVRKYPLLKALIIDGQNNHAVWPKSTIMMKQYLEETGLFKVDVDRTQFTWQAQREKEYLPLAFSGETEDLKKPKSDPDFIPNFKKYDVVISNFGWMAADWPEATQKALEDYVKHDGGFVLVHAADNCFPKWLEYNKMIGLGGWGGRNEKDGPYVYFTDEGKEVRDTSPGSAGSHGPGHEFAVTVRDTNHPITKGMPPVWLHTKDECYAKLRGPAENMTVLATGRDVSGKAPTQRHEPILMVLEYGKGRVFHTTLGHDDYSFEGVGFIASFTRGAEWAATGKVTQEIPDDFPTAKNRTSRSFDLK